MIKVRAEINKIEIKNNLFSKVKIISWKRRTNWRNTGKTDLNKEKGQITNIITKKRVQLLI